MRTRPALVAVALGLATTLGMGIEPAGAHRGGGYEDDCRGGGCGNEREEDYEGANCKYVCPEFNDSPVHDAFNFAPQVCLPGATCHFDGSEEEEPAPEG